MATNGESRQDGMREKRREEKRGGEGRREERRWGRGEVGQQDERGSPCQGWGFSPKVLASLQGKAGEAPQVSGGWGALN